MTKFHRPGGLYTAEIPHASGACRPKIRVWAIEVPVRSLLLAHRGLSFLPRSTLWGGVVRSFISPS